MDQPLKPAIVLLRLGPVAYLGASWADSLRACFLVGTWISFSVSCLFGSWETTDLLVFSAKMKEHKNIKATLTYKSKQQLSASKVLLNKKGKCCYVKEKWYWEKSLVCFSLKQWQSLSLSWHNNMSLACQQIQIQEIMACTWKHLK